MGGGYNCLFIFLKNSRVHFQYFISLLLFFFVFFPLFHINMGGGVTTGEVNPSLQIVYCKYNIYIINKTKSIQYILIGSTHLIKQLVSLAASCRSGSFI